MCAGEGGGGGCRNLLVCPWLGCLSANQAQWFAWEREGRRDHPSHHYHLAGPPSLAHMHNPHPGVKARAETGRQGVGDRLDGGRGVCVRGQMDRDGTGRGRDAHAEVEGLAGWMDQDAVGFRFLGSPSHAHTCPLRGCRGYCYFRKGGGFQLATHEPPSFIRHGQDDRSLYSL